MVNGFVYVVESPSSDDLLSDQVEGRALCNALALARIPFAYSLATDLKTLRLSLGERLRQALQMPAYAGRAPILHLSMHGNETGVGLTSDEFLPWQQLHDELIPLLNMMKGGLLITMSSCFGISGCRMAMTSGPHATFWALVGHTDSVDWSDAAVAYITFYHQFFKGTPIERCIEAMKVASGDARFIHLPGQAVRANWLQSVSTFGLAPPSNPFLTQGLQPPGAGLLGGA